MKAAIPRTAAFSWSPASLDAAEPYLATGTVAGAFDESFSNESSIEIWQPQWDTKAAGQPKPLAEVKTTAKLHRLLWGYKSSWAPKGLIAAGLENGELGVWNAQKIFDGAADSQILRQTIHTGPVRALDFNAQKPEVLASGAINGEIYIWDLEKPEKPLSPGAPSSKLSDITSLGWNPQVGHILASSSSSGYTIVWDLKSHREVSALQYGGGAGTAVGGVGAAGMNGGALAAGARRGMSAVAWHPGMATKLATASEDDSSPVIMLWDLRNARAPEKILTGHDKGILSLSWCKQDSDLLLSCGKDNRTIAWNPQSCEIVGELPASSNWNFDVQWCPSNPGLLATASFDGQVGVHSLQSTNQKEAETAAAAAPTAADGSDLFNLPAVSDAASPGFSLKQPPKWLKRPVSAAFGFGGQMVSFASGSGSRAVHIRDVVTEPGIVARARRLQEAIDGQSLAQFCDERSREAGVSRPDDVANWKALQTLFQADSRDELVALLGFSKEDVAAKVSSAISAYKSGGPGSLSALNSTPGTPSVKPTSTVSEADSSTPHEPVVAFAPETVVSEHIDLATSETSTTTSSEPKATTEGGESEVTEPSLFSDDAANNGILGDQSGVEFFNSISGESGAGVRSAVPERVLVPHVSVPPASSVAATAGSPGPSSVASADLKQLTFRIYPSDESEADKLITRALVLGDFESAVGLCISTDRFADALLLAVRGGPDLLARTQKTYFERRTTSLPYLRVFQSIVSDDLSDVVQNADLTEWQEIFVVLCTFAKPDDFSNLAEQLGQRLEFQYVKSAGAAKGSGSDSAKLAKAKLHRKNAVLCYLAAGKLEKVAGMWIDEMKEEEAAIRAAQKSATTGSDVGVNGASVEAASLYSAHAEALQTFIEKITVFQNAVGYVDADLQQPTTNHEVASTGARTYKLAALYDRIHEYIELLADQGLIAPALKYVNQTPADYKTPSSVSTSGATTGLGAHPARERLLQADTARTGGQNAAAAASASSSRQSASRAIPAAAQPSYQSLSQVYDPYGAQSNPYGAPAAPAVAQPSQYSAYAPSVPQMPAPAVNTYASPYDSSVQQQATQPDLYAPMAPMVPAPVSNSAYAPPPQLQSQPQQASLPPPPPPKRTDQGWNDVPDLPSAPKRTTSAIGNKAAPIMSPFPNSPAATPGPYGQPQGPPQAQAGAPRQGAFSPPPPGPGFGRAPAASVRPPHQGPPRAGSTTGSRPSQAGVGVPPVPSVGPVPSAASGPYAPAPGQQLQQGPPGPGQMQQRPAAPSGPYAPPPQQQQQGPPQGNLGVPPPSVGMPIGPPGQARPPMGAAINRSATPGGGAGAPRSATPVGNRGPVFKYPPGDRSHLPEPTKPIFGILSRELARLKATTPPAQKRMADDVERRLNILFDYLNNSLPLGPDQASAGKMFNLLQGIVQAIDRRDMQAALGMHLQAATTASGDVAQALVGVKMLISKMGN